MSFSEILDIDRTGELKNRTWWWWWHIFFLKNQENPERTKQLMILWGTRNTDFVEVNDIPWRRRHDIQRKENRLEFYGLCASWFYDGSVMREPLFVDQGEAVSSWEGEDGEVFLEGEGKHSYRKDGDRYLVRISRSDVEIDLTMSSWSPFMSRIQPTGKQYLANLGYRMYKIRGCHASGRIRVGNSESEEEGSSYFQKVRISSPTSPWYWGVFHTDTGCYVDYFMPHIGPPVLRRSLHHQSSLDWGEHPLSKGWQFYDAEDDELHRIKSVWVSKSYENDLPTFVLRGEERDCSIEMVMKSYSRAYWKVRQPFLKFFCSYLYYNEYPVNVMKFDFKSRKKRITLSDLGRIVGNCEHSWGMI